MGQLSTSWTLPLHKFEKGQKCLSTTIKFFWNEFCLQMPKLSHASGAEGTHELTFHLLLCLGHSTLWKIQVARATSLSSHMVFKCHQTPTIFFQKKYSRITPPSISLIFQIPITLPVQWVYLLSNNSTCTITLPFKLAFPLYNDLPWCEISSKMQSVSQSSGADL